MDHSREGVGGTDAVVGVNDVLILAANQILRIVSTERLDGCGNTRDDAFGTNKFTVA